MMATGGGAKGGVEERGTSDRGGGKDARFAAMHSDPRFARFPKAKRTLEIDKRFEGMFKDEDFQVKSIVDKRGRRVQPARRNEDMKRYYRLRDEDDWKDNDVKPSTTDAVGDEVVLDQPAKRHKAGHGEAGQADVGDHTKYADGSISSTIPPATATTQQRGQRKAGFGSVSNRSQPQPVRELSAPTDDEHLEPAVQLLQRGADLSLSEECNLDTKERAAKERWARARGLTDMPSSSSEDGNDSSGGTKHSSAADEEASEAYDSADEPLTEEEGDGDVVLDPAEWGAGAMAANPEEPIPVSDETRRLAVVDLDWDHVRAVDVYAVLRSFVPKGGEIKRVSVYPSDYGLQRMAEEAVLGPQGIYKAPAKPLPHAAEAAGEGTPTANGSNAEEDDGAVAVDRLKLRMYEKSKLRYYYAVVECDSVATALRVYNECDGMELERSACKFDLRFIPDEQNFEGRQVRDTANALPAGYEAPAVFNVALQHTDPKLSWDADDEGRKRKLHKRMTEDEIKEADFAAYLGSDDEAGGSGDEGGGAGDQDAEALRERYRKLLTEGAGKAGDHRGRKAWGQPGGDGEADREGGVGSDEEDEGEEGGDVAGQLASRRNMRDRDMEMEVSFMPGLDALGERLLAKKRERTAKKDLTVWTAYLERRAEKRRLKKLQGKKLHAGDSSDENDSEDDNGRSKKAAVGGSDDNEAAAAVADDPFFQHDEDAFKDPFFQDDEGAAQELQSGLVQPAAAAGKKPKSDKAKEDKAMRQLAKEDAAKKRAELELLLMDDSALKDAARGVRSATLMVASSAAGAEEKRTGKLTKKERRQAKREAKAKARAGSDEEDIGGEGVATFAVDLEDPRFGEMFTSPHFALDPTDPRVSKSGTGVGSAGQKAAELLKEVAKRRSIVQAKQSTAKQAAAVTNAAAGPPKAEDMNQAQGGTLQKLELRAMVAKLKHKGTSASRATISASGASKGVKDTERSAAGAGAVIQQKGGMKLKK